MRSLDSTKARSRSGGCRTTWCSSPSCRTPRPASCPSSRCARNSGTTSCPAHEHQVESREPRRVGRNRSAGEEERADGPDVPAACRGARRGRRRSAGARDPSPWLAGLLHRGQRCGRFPQPPGRRGAAGRGAVQGAARPREADRRRSGRAGGGNRQHHAPALRSRVRSDPRPLPARRCPRSSRSASLTSRASRTLLAFLVAVDVGHYYGEPGVISASGRAEFEYNLELASQLKGLLNEVGLKVRMIGERGDYAILHYRTRDAAGADLFLSIHHDSVRLSQLPHAHRFAGFSLFVSRRNPRADKTLACPSAIAARLRAAGFPPSRYHADPVLGENRPFADEINGVHYYDNLTVARSAAMPAVLVEAGVIVNPAEEARLRDPSHH